MQLATEVEKPMQSLVSQIKPVVQQEQMLTTLASSTETFLDRDFRIAVFFVKNTLDFARENGAPQHGVHEKGNMLLSKED